MVLSRLGINAGTRFGFLRETDPVFIALERAGIFMEPVLAGRTGDPESREGLTNSIDWSNRTAAALNAWCNRPDVGRFLHAYRQPLPGEIAFFSDLYAGIVTESTAIDDFMCVIMLPDKVKIVEASSKHLAANGYRLRGYARLDK